MLHRLLKMLAKIEERLEKIDSSDDFEIVFNPPKSVGEEELGKKEKHDQEKIKSKNKATTITI